MTKGGIICEMRYLYKIKLIFIKLLPRRGQSFGEYPPVKILIKPG
jgi:hypothetical protein